MADPITNLVLRSGVGPGQSPSAIALHSFAPLGGTVAAGAFSFFDGLTGFVDHTAFAGMTGFRGIIRPLGGTISEDPIITSDGGAATASVDVSSPDTAVTTVTATGTAPVSFMISGGADEELFMIDASTGELFFLGDSIDGSYVVIVAAVNAEAITTQTITVTVSSGYTASAVHFDGSTTFSRGGLLTGVTTPDTMLFSCWFDVSSSAGNKYPWGSYDNGQVVMRLSPSTPSLRIDVHDAGSNADRLNTITATYDDWMNVLYAFDRNDQAKCIALINAVDVTDITNFSMAGPISFAGESDFFVGTDGYGGDAITGGEADFYLAFGQWLDLTNLANVEKFIKNGKPVYLGANGELPTGTAPTIFGSGNAATFLQPNLGTGGPFTLSGALTDATKLSSAVLDNGGDSWIDGETFTVDGGDVLALGVVDTTAAGAIVTFHLTSYGSNYTSTLGNAITSTSGSGENATINTTAVAASPSD